MARGFIAAIVILLIGNPFCCCVLGSGDSGTTPAKTTPSCCLGKANDSPESGVPVPAVPNPSTCGCDFADFTLSEDKALRPALLASPAPPIPNLVQRDLTLPRPGETIIVFRSHSPPGDCVRPLSVRILYGVFRC